MTEPFVHTCKPSTPWSLVIHGGAGGRIKELSALEGEKFSDGLRAAWQAGADVLAVGGSALDAVCASVRSLEDNELFNAGRGAALTLAGKAELDASVMTGDGRAGAVAASKHAKNPVDLARYVMENTPHVLLCDPDAELNDAAGVETVEPDYFVTEARQAQLARILAAEEAPLKHGTVGAAARDAEGNLAAATSTGGISKQLTGRVGDTPIPGAGTWAHHATLAYSGTGDGEAFIKGAVGHDLHARVLYGRQPLAEAIVDTLNAELAPRDATGGVIVVEADGTVTLGRNSDMMFAAFEEGGEVVTWL